MCSSGLRAQPLSALATNRTPYGLLYASPQLSHSSIFSISINSIKSLFPFYIARCAETIDYFRSLSGVMPLKDEIYFIIKNLKCQTIYARKISRKNIFAERFPFLLS